MLWFQVPYLPELWMYSAPDRFAKSLSSTDPELLPASISDPSICRGMLSYYRAAAREQLPRWLGGPPPTRRARAPLAVQVPVLQICGRNDVALGEGLFTELPLKRWTPHPRSRVLMLDASHWIMHDKPKEVNEALLRFVQEE
jgi:pimeloyl-ACP methyl ester carboxylesterase